MGKCLKRWRIARLIQTCYTYMRRKGFTWDSHNQTYVPAVTKADTILKELDSGAPFKADMIIKRFEEMGDDADPRAIASEFGFCDHRELGEYMESKQLFWDSAKKNYAIANLEVSQNFLKDTLPESILKTIDLNNLELQNGTYVSKKLEETRSDLLFRTTINQKEAYLYLLFEHKSYLDKNVGLQLLNYLVSIWNQKIKNEKTNWPMPLMPQ